MLLTYAQYHIQMVLTLSSASHSMLLNSKTHRLIIGSVRFLPVPRSELFWNLSLITHRLFLGSARLALPLMRR